MATIAMAELTDINNMSFEVRHRRLNWLDHVLRRGGENDCVIALDWRPEDRRVSRRLTIAWRRTLEKECDKAGWMRWGCGQNGGTKQSGLDRQCDSLMHHSGTDRDNEQSLCSIL